MAYIKDGPRVTRHVSFTQKENNDLCKRAAKVGMEVVPYIKHEALHGTVRGYSLAALTRHEKQIGDILQAVKEAAARPHPDRWKYEYDLEVIQDQMAELLEIEKDIQRRVRHGLK